MGMMEKGAAWQLEFETMEERCGYLLASGLWTDCTFIVGPKKAVIPAHKLILAMASPVFEAMFYGGLSDENEPIISIPDVEPEAFRALMPYIYTGNINISSLDMAIDLWYGASKYMLPHLEKECNSYILSVVGPKNVCRAYEISQLFEEKALMDKCIEIITTNTKEVLNGDSFEDMDISTLMKVLSFDYLNVESELDLFYAVERYAKAEQKRAQEQTPDDDDDDGVQPSAKPSELSETTTEEEVLSVNVESNQSRPVVKVDSKKPAGAVTSKPEADEENFEEVPERPTIRNALQKIRFLSLTPQQFAGGPARSDLLTKEETFALLMNIASTDSPVPMPTGFSKSRQQRKPCSDSVPL